MVVETRTIKNRFCVVSFDIEAAKPAIRSHILRVLRKHGMKMRLQSEYIGIYSPALHDELTKFAENLAGVDLEITTPTFSIDTEAQLVKDKYEQAFIRDFDEVEKKLRRIDAILVTETLPTDEAELQKAITAKIVYQDKETEQYIPYPADKVKTILDSAQYLLSDLEISLSRRREREVDADEATLESFDIIAHRIKEMRSMVKVQEKSLAARAKREGKQ